MLHISITTPEKTILDQEADEVVIPTITGEITVLPSHVPLLSQLAPGEVAVKKGSQIRHLAITGGFLEIGNDTVSLLADYAISGEDANERRAQEAKERAEKLMKEKGTEQQYAIAQGELQKALAELRLISKVRKRTNKV